MSPDAKTALLASITHWEENAKVTCWAEAKIFCGACALCQLFQDRRLVGPDANPDEEVGYPDDEDEVIHLCYNNDLKELCPVAERTGQEECAGSPWDHAHKLYIKVPFPPWREFARDLDEFQAAANEELDFLKSLLSED